MKQRKVPACEALAVIHAIWVTLGIDIQTSGQDTKYDRRFIMGRRIGISLMRKRGYGMAEICKVLKIARSPAYSSYARHLQEIKSHTNEAKQYKAHLSMAKSSFLHIVENGLWEQVVLPKAPPSFYVFPGLP